MSLESFTRRLVCAALVITACAQPDRGHALARADEAIARAKPRLAARLQPKGLTFGAPIFIRIFKEEDQLEVWMERNGRYEYFQTYRICTYSGDLGPKLREGDRQSPEGFYSVGRSQMNPASRFHLSFNLGFPNAFDRANCPMSTFSRSGENLRRHRGSPWMPFWTDLKPGYDLFQTHRRPPRVTVSNRRYTVRS